jgi:hypothetical protein
VRVSGSLARAAMPQPSGWRRAVADAAEVKPFPAAWNDALARTKKRLSEVDASGVALAQMVDKHVERLVGFAERYLTKDPTIAARAARDALRLRPAHPKASSLFEQLGSPPSDCIALFDGRSLAGFDIGPEEKMWTVVDGNMVGDVTTGTIVMMHKKALKGDFDYRIEAKILERREGYAAFVIGGAVKFNTHGTHGDRQRRDRGPRAGRARGGRAEVHLQQRDRQAPDALRSAAVEHV